MQNIDPHLMSFAEAGQFLGGISESSIRQRKCGTESLTHVSGFGRRVFLIRAEVEDLVAKKIEQAKASHRKNFRLIKQAI
jgi:hypothetical protein